MNIEDNTLEDKHIGQEVTFYDYNTGTTDSGEISSWNKNFVFVKYRTSNTRQATKPEDLYWKNREGEFRIKHAIIRDLKLKGILDINNFTIYVNGISDNRLEVSIHCDNESITQVKCIKSYDGNLHNNLHNNIYRIIDIDDIHLKDIKRKIQLHKLIPLTDEE